MSQPASLQVVDRHEARLAHARAVSRLSPLGQIIGEAFLRAYLDGPPTLARGVYQRAYAEASVRLLACPEGSWEARAARREMQLYRDALAVRG